MGKLKYHYLMVECLLKQFSNKDRFMKNARRVFWSLLGLGILLTVALLFSNSRLLLAGINANV